jgi:predicted PurR-regulated permease PerM
MVARAGWLRRRPPGALDMHREDESAADELGPASNDPSDDSSSPGFPSGRLDQPEAPPPTPPAPSHSAPADEPQGDAPPAQPEAAEPPALQVPITIRNLALSFVAAPAAVLLLRYMQEVLIPLALGGLLFYALDTPVDWLQKRRLPRALGAAVVLGLFVTGVAGLAYSLQGQAMAVADGLPEGARKIRELIRGTSTASNGALEKVDEAARQLQDAAPAPAPARGVTRVEIQSPPFSVSDYLWSGSMSAALFVNQMVVILFLTYFMLLSDDLFKRKLVELAGPTLTKKKVTIQILDDIASQIQRFLLIQLVTSAIVAVATGLALSALGVEQAALWGLVAGIFNSIPYYGPVIVTAALSAVAFVQFETLGMVAAVAGVALLITTLEGMLLTPWWMGRAAQINRVSMFGGLLFWTWMWGVWGLLLAVPMMMVIKAVCDHVEDLQPVGRLLGE